MEKIDITKMCMIDNNGRMYCTMLKLNELVKGYNQQQKDNDYFQRKIDELIKDKMSKNL